MASVFDTNADRAVKSGSAVKRESIESIMRTSGVGKDQPVTFKTKIKSSGYNTPPTALQFARSSSSACKKPQKSASKTPSAAASAAGAGGGGGLLGRRSYPAGADAPTRKQAAVESCGPQHSALIRRLKFAPDASRLATASADNTVAVLRTPLKRLAGEGAYLTGHTGAVNSVSWTRDASMLVSTSVDRTARVWSPLKSTAEALVVIDRRGRGGIGGAAGGSKGQTVGSDAAAKPPVAKDEKNGPLNDEVKQAQFFYMDRFLSLIVGGRMLLYELKLANDACDDLERLRKRHRFREVACIQSCAERISAMTCVNDFLSHILLAACSNRSIEGVCTSRLCEVCCLLKTSTQNACPSGRRCRITPYVLIQFGMRPQAS
eukprot:Tamp_09483.p1 GENE.Tamp_09483~~Tamp_09483.p1  ORF type:complete len:376 (+),score=47.62 Tamp_09483:163-1290(+)